jgi:hypothetical protein
LKTFQVDVIVTREEYYSVEVEAVDEDSAMDIVEAETPDQWGAPTGVAEICVQIEGVAEVG